MRRTILLLLVAATHRAFALRDPCPIAQLVEPRVAESGKDIDAYLVAAARAVRLDDNLTNLNLSTGGNGKGRSLPASFGGLCGFASASVLHQLSGAEILGVAHQTRTVFGGGPHHTIVFVPLRDPATGKPSTKRGLWVDLTMKQFNDRVRVGGGGRLMPPDYSIVTEMAKDPEARTLLTSIFKNGYVEVDDHALQVLGRAFRLDTKTGKMPPLDSSLRVEKLLDATVPDLYTPRPDPDELFDFSVTDFPRR